MHTTKPAHDTEQQPPLRGTILVVDDDAQFRRTVARHLERVGDGCEVREASGGQAALVQIESGGIDVVLLDLAMPDMSGLDVIPRALAHDPDLCIMMLSGQGTASTAARCMQRGAFDYLTKPVEGYELGEAVMRGLKLRRAQHQDRAAVGDAPSNEPPRPDLRVLTGTLDVLINTMEARNPLLAGHSHRVAAMAATIADQLGLPEDAVEEVRIAGRLHDLGKIGVRETVLNKQEALDPEETAEVRAHTRIGADILVSIPELATVAEYVASHHDIGTAPDIPPARRGTRSPSEVASCARSRSSTR